MQPITRSQFIKLIAKQDVLSLGTGYDYEGIISASLETSKKYTRATKIAAARPIGRRVIVNPTSKKEGNGKKAKVVIDDVDIEQMLVERSFDESLTFKKKRGKSAKEREIVSHHTNAMKIISHIAKRSVTPEEKIVSHTVKETNPKGLKKDISKMIINQGNSKDQKEPGMHPLQPKMKIVKQTPKPHHYDTPNNHVLTKSQLGLFRSRSAMSLVQQNPEIFTKESPAPHHFDHPYNMMHDKSSRNSSRANSARIRKDALATPQAPPSAKRSPLKKRHEVKAEEPINTGELSMLRKLQIAMGDETVPVIIKKSKREAKKAREYTIVQVSNFVIDNNKLLMGELETVYEHVRIPGIESLKINLMCDNPFISEDLEKMY